MKLSTRLMVGFGACTALGLAIAIFGSLRVQTLSTKVQELAHNRMVKMVQFSQIKDNLNAIGIHTRNIVLKPEAAFVSTEKEKIIALRAKNSALLQELDKTITLDKGRALLKVIQETRGPYNQLLDRSMDLAIQGANREAVLLLSTEVRDKQTILFQAVGDAMELQSQIARSLSEEAMGLSTTTAQTMLSLALAMAVVGVLAILRMLHNMHRALGAEPDLVNAAMERIAKGDLMTPVEVRSNDQTSTIAVLDSMKHALGGIVNSVRRNAESVSSASVQIANGNQDLALRTSQQASALEETVVAIGSLSTIVRQSASNATQANALASTASGVAQQGGAVVGEVVQTMQGINDSSKRIADIISVIDGIAFQTNILALNAAVEAARAGEQGRGFAVVASEVRSLAGRSAEAAKEIKTLIEDSVNRVDQGAMLVGQAGKTMAEIVDSIQKVGAMVSQIAQAAEKQDTGIQHITSAMEALDQSTQQNAALVEQSTAAAASLAQQAQDLVHTVAAFQLNDHPAG